MVPTIWPSMHLAVTLGKLQAQYDMIQVFFVFPGTVLQVSVASARFLCQSFAIERIVLVEASCCMRKRLYCVLM